MRVYVAGSSGELKRVERVIAHLRLMGVTITHDWTKDIRAAREDGFASDADLPDDEACKHALTDLAAVASAHAVLFLAPTTPTRGAWVEMGYAYGCGKPVVVAGPAARASIFSRLGNVVPTDEAGLDAVLEAIS